MLPDPAPRSVHPALRIGCSGFSYAAWRGTFYPKSVPAASQLEYYAARFDTVELNGTFYRLPAAETFARWAAATPPSFVFAVKASRYLTHHTRLLAPVEPVERLFARAAHLGGKLGPVLYQLPARQTRDLDRLAAFLRVLPPTLVCPGGDRVAVRHVIEFRHPSWYDAATFALLNDFGVSLCLHDKADSAIVEPEVGPIVYARFHGVSGHYHGEYGAAGLRGWVDRLAAAWRSGRDVYAYFNNDPDASATRDAMALRTALEATLTAGPSGAAVLARPSPGPVSIRGR